MRSHLAFVDRVRRHPVAADLVLAVAIAAIGIATAFKGHETSAGHSGPVLLAALATLPIALRRVHPRLVFVVVAATFAASVEYDSYWPVGAVVAFYTVAAHLQRREALYLAERISSPSASRPPHPSSTCTPRRHRNLTPSTRDSGPDPAASLAPLIAIFSGGLGGRSRGYWYWRPPTMSLGTRGRELWLPSLLVGAVLTPTPHGREGIWR